MTLLITRKPFDEKHIDLKNPIISIGELKAVNADGIPYLKVSDNDAKIFSLSFDMLELIIETYEYLLSNNEKNVDLISKYDNILKSL